MLDPDNCVLGFQPVFMVVFGITCIFDRSWVFDPLYIHLFFVLILCALNLRLYINRLEINLFKKLAVVAMLTLIPWFLLVEVDFMEPVGRMVWGAIYVCAVMGQLLVVIY